MRVGDVVEVVWLDSGLILHDYTEGDAAEHDLEHVTCYGRVVHSCPQRLVLAHETGRGDVGTYGVIYRPCVLSVRVLDTAPVKVETINDESPERPTIDRRGTVSGWS